MKILDDLIALGCTVEPCGSRVTCSPAPTDTDADYLVLTPPTSTSVGLVVDAMALAGFRWEGSEHYQNAAASGFMSWRADDINLIVTSNAAWADRHRAATAVCKRLNLMDKSDRIALFQAVLYGAVWEGVA